MQIHDAYFPQEGGPAILEFKVPQISASHGVQQYAAGAKQVCVCAALAALL